MCKIKCKFCTAEMPGADVDGDGIEPSCFGCGHPKKKCIMWKKILKKEKQNQKTP